MKRCLLLTALLGWLCTMPMTGLAQESSGSEVLGCMDETACNYEASATLPPLVPLDLSITGDMSGQNYCQYIDGYGEACYISSMVAQFSISNADGEVLYTYQLDYESAGSGWQLDGYGGTIPVPGYTNDNGSATDQLLVEPGVYTITATVTDMSGTCGSFNIAITDPDEASSVFSNGFQIQGDMWMFEDPSGNICGWNWPTWSPGDPAVEHSWTLDLSGEDGCEFLDGCDVCGGDNSTCADECGVPNGDNSTCSDDCGVPNGDNSTCSDACGVPNGDNSSCTDACGILFGDGSTCDGCMDDTACNYDPTALNPSITSYDLVIEATWGGSGWTNWESTVHIDSEQEFTIIISNSDNSFNQQYNMSFSGAWWNCYPPVHVYRIY